VKRSVERTIDDLAAYALARTFKLGDHRADALEAIAAVLRREASRIRQDKIDSNDYVSRGSRR
jgi:hypothetical protein